MGRGRAPRNPGCRATSVSPALTVKPSVKLAENRKAPGSPTPASPPTSPGSGGGRWGVSTCWSRAGRIPITLCTRWLGPAAPIRASSPRLAAPRALTRKPLPRRDRDIVAVMSGGKQAPTLRPHAHPPSNCTSLGLIRVCWARAPPRPGGASRARWLPARLPAIHRRGWEASGTPDNHPRTPRYGCGSCRRGTAG